jgi:hypothetical protein
MAYFQTKNTDLGKFLEGIAMKDVDILYGHFWYIFWPFDLVYFVVIC